jgi:hypothetical protein
MARPRFFKVTREFASMGYTLKNGKNGYIVIGESIKFSNLSQAINWLYGQVSILEESD